MIKGANQFIALAYPLLSLGSVATRRGYELYFVELMGGIVTDTVERMLRERVYITFRLQYGHNLMTFHYLPRKTDAEKKLTCTQLAVATRLCVKCFSVKFFRSCGCLYYS